jgi:hypothetical protein
VARVARVRRNATWRVSARAELLHYAKTLVFLSRCSNPNTVRAILRALSRLRYSPKLGGQHGEEAKDEDEVSDEKRRKEDPEEEVSTRCFSVVDFDEVDDCVTRAGESRERCAQSRPHFETAGPFDERGPRRDRGTRFTGLRFAA